MTTFADFHCDTLLNLYLKDLDFSVQNKFGHLDLPRLQEANHIFQCFAVFCDPKSGQEAALRQTLRLINLAREKIFSCSQVKWIKTSSDLAEIGPERLGGLLSIEGADFLGDDLFLLDIVHALGVRLITLTWNGRNTIADGVKVGGNAGGLTDFGEKAVKKMQDLKIVVDVSHLSEKGFWDVSTVSTRPFVASHSNAWNVCNHPRNLKDDQIREIARAKGLIGMNLCRPFVAEAAKEQTLNTVVKHVQYIADIAGPEVICLGCDLDGIREMPEGMEDVRDVISISGLLDHAGFSSQEIKAICSGNLIRFMSDNLE